MSTSFDLSITRLALFAVLASALVFGGIVQLADADDFSEVPVWDGEATESGDLLNRFGGGIVGSQITFTASPTKEGDGAYCFAVDVVEGASVFSGLSLTGFFSEAGGPPYIDTRSLTNFEQLSFWIKNETGESFRLEVELKDYRDTSSHSAVVSFQVAAAQSGWIQLITPLPTGTAANGWTKKGSPDFSRIRTLFFLIHADRGESVDGDLFIDELTLREIGPVLDTATAPVEALLERLVQRQFYALWGCRDRSTGLLPLNSEFANIVALNSTAGLVQILPRAIEEGWISRSDADSYVGKLVASLNRSISKARDFGGGYLPPRYLDRMSLAPEVAAPGGVKMRQEESPIDAAFVFLALFKYRELVADKGISAHLEKYDFSRFESGGGQWHRAFRLATGDLDPGFYDGYSGEVHLLTLAAELSDTKPNDFGASYHSASMRLRDFLIDPGKAHLVHQNSDFRAPFVQWLAPLFVDCRELGLDNYPGNPSHRSNPLGNAVHYQRDVHAWLADLGRGDLLQPDASYEFGSQQYEQFSAYQSFGQPDLIMPWSIAFSFLGEPSVAEPAFRKLLAAKLHGPLGLVDSSSWATGQPAPASLPARIDFWNLALCEIALVEYLYRDNRAFSRLPEVANALDKVFQGLNLAISRQPGGVDISFYGVAGANYIIEYSDNLKDWTELASFSGDNDIILFNDSSGEPLRHYRVVSD